MDTTDNKKYSVMLIEDSEADRYIAKRLLDKTHKVKHVLEMKNPLMALDFFKAYIAEQQPPEQLPDIIMLDINMLDINMPHMNGFEFHEQFMQLPKSETILPHVKTFMVTSSNSPQDKDKALSTPTVTGFIVKPLKFSTVERIFSAIEGPSDSPVDLSEIA